MEWLLYVARRYRDVTGGSRTSRYWRLRQLLVLMVGRYVIEDVATSLPNFGSVVVVFREGNRSLVLIEILHSRLEVYGYLIVVPLGLPADVSQRCCRGSRLEYCRRIVGHWQRLSNFSGGMHIKHARACGSATRCTSYQG